MNGSARRTAALLLTWLLTMAPFGRALAQTKEQCIAAFDEGQELREKVKLRAAREQFLICSHDACASMLRRDCAQALEAVERELPSVSLGAQDKSGADLSDLRVSVDGSAVALDQSGRSVDVDPGQHVVKFERDGFRPVTKQVLLRMGEKNRVIVATMLREGESDALSTPSSSPTADKKRAPLSAWFYVFTGVGVAGLGSFTYFAVTGKEEKDHLGASCSPRCNDSQVAGVRDRYIAADISLGVGIAALGAAAYFLFAYDRTP